ncbi:MAG: hypothetical protein ACOYVF_06400 [Candidatus Zixiibacteriota bacterium]
MSLNWKNKGRLRIIFLTALLFIGLLNFGQAQQTLSPRKKWYDSKIRPDNSTLGQPLVEYTTHNRGNIQLAIANNGTFGTYGQDIADPFTGSRIQSLIYPKNSDIVYLWVGAFWIGAVVGRDTLVSTGTEDFYENQEFWPGEKFGDASYFTYRSIDLNSRYFDEDAHSEEDITCEYYDTLTDPTYVSYDRFDQRPHIPLGIKVSQKTMAWSYDYADDFILFDYQIENIGDERLNNVYMGIWVDGDVWHVSRNNPEGWNDDIVGFLRDHPAPEGGICVDTVNIAYTADNDGDPDGSEWDYRSAKAAVGVRVVRTPQDSLKYSYNWWIINYYDAGRDFGPRRIPSTGDPFRSFGSRLGTPEGDRNKYYIMRHEEFDYDLLFTAVDHGAEGWLHPPENAEVYAQGYDTRYLLSFGPFNIDPGQKLPISLAIVGGDNLHQEPTDFESLFDPYNPGEFYNSLDFSNLALNSRWASWIYDNPGVDTDGDNYYGKYRICTEDFSKDNTDSVDDNTGGQWYEGDGVPDFKGAGPPPAPRMRVIPAESKLTIRWNGYYSENTPDIFLQKIDFEGYRVYAALDDRTGSFVLLSSYDKENYNRYFKKILPGGEYGWALEETPFTLDSLKILYDDPEFDPLQFTPGAPLEYHDSLFYFEPQDYNVSDLSSLRGIHKVYPEITSPPPADSTLWSEDELTYDYGQPLPKYYEYEYVYENILPTIAYYVSVTAFDFGSPIAGLKALETKPVNNMIVEYPLTPSDSVEAKNLDVYVYPNPYRIDGNYFEDGFEGRDDTYKIPDRIRRIHFANLPKVCKIYIFSLDGDLVRELDHNYPDGGPQSMHDTWDLITRNTQRAVTGIYYFVVESSTRTQIGKFVIIR